ncbi:SGNH/GDSL hydrolase family protein [Verrucomicrobiaceae bacterium 227]
MMKYWILLLQLLALSRGSALTFQDNDRVVFLGNTVIERTQKYGHLETALTLASEKANLRFRNLGWSGDTVYGDARSYFGPPQEGFDRLKDNLTEFKPNVILICYGAVAAFDGPAGLENFIKGYDRLLEMVNTAAGPREIVLISPPPAESLAAPMPDMTEHNKRLANYRDAIRDLAKKRGHQFADLFDAIGTGVTGLTDNGLHYTEQGNLILARLLVRELKLTPPSIIHLESESGEQLRHTIIAKNKLFFFQWRPSNETYLRLFRKHEQGQNAKELAQFDPLIQEEEGKIEALRQTTLNLKK